MGSNGNVGANLQQNWRGPGSFLFWLGGNRGPGQPGGLAGARALGCRSLGLVQAPTGPLPNCVALPGYFSFWALGVLECEGGKPPSGSGLAVGTGTAPHPGALEEGVGFSAGLHFVLFCFCFACMLLALGSGGAFVIFLL